MSHASRSSSSGRSRRGSKRMSDAMENDDPQPAVAQAPAVGPVNPKKMYIFNKTFSEFPEKLIAVTKPSSSNMKAWNKLSDDAQEMCIRRVMRLFLTKGARGEMVAKAAVLKVLKEIDPTYSSCANNVLQIVKVELKNTFGYNLSSNADPLVPKGTEFIVFNGLLSPQLQDILSDSASTTNKAWMGFVFVVLQIVNSSPKKTIDNHSLLSKLREIDGRFPESVAKAKGSSSTSSSKMADIPIPELGADFPGLMKRMVSERYVTVVKTAGAGRPTDPEDQAKAHYTFGSRFYAELGQKQIITSYYLTLGQRVDQGLLDDAAAMEQEMRDLVPEEEEEEEEEAEGEAEGKEAGAEVEEGRDKAKGKKKRKST